MTDSGTFSVRWVAGVSRVSQSTYVDGNALVWGFRINDGPFQETARMIFADDRELARTVLEVEALRTPATP